VKARGAMGGRFLSAALLACLVTSAANDVLAQLQAKFDTETNAVRKAKIMEKLGNAQFEEARRAGQKGDFSGVDLTLEKYRDNVRVALESLKKQEPDAEKHSNGYRQLQFLVHRSLREVTDSTLAAPPEYQPPLELVRKDLVAMDDEMIKLLFPAHPVKQKQEQRPPEKSS
jgi:hypothetical protein